MEISNINNELNSKTYNIKIIADYLNKLKENKFKKLKTNFPLLLKKENPVNKVEERDSITITSIEKEPFKEKYRPECIIQFIEQMEILKNEKLDNEIQYMDCLQINGKLKQDNVIEYENLITIFGIKQSLSPQSCEPSDNFSMTILGEFKLKNKLENTNEMITSEEKNSKYKIEERDSIILSFEKEPKLISVIFVSFDENIHYSIICKNDDKFSKIQALLYNKDPEYKNLKNRFIINGKEINIFKSIKDNKIKNGDIIRLK